MTSIEIITRLNAIIKAAAPYGVVAEQVMQPLSQLRDDIAASEQVHPAAKAPMATPENRAEVEEQVTG